jgi:RNA recognition motif-containing protein
MNMYVSNLSFSLTDDDLKRLFEEFGAVSSAKVITDRETGRSRGFGFVEMASTAEANNAIQALNNKQTDGRNMGVSEARERESRSTGGNRRW